MDFFTSKKPTNPGEEDQPSGTELFSSAKILAEAAQSSFNKKDTAGVDKAKVAEAADDILEAGSRYGKLDEKGYGQYVDKAEGYLHKYETTAPAAGDQGKAPPPAAAAKADETVERPPPAKAEETAERPPPVAAAAAPSGEEKEDGGSGGAFKMAKGFLGKTRPWK